MTETVTQPGPVTMPVTFKVYPGLEVTAEDVTNMVREIVDLTAEVAMLKRQLADTNGAPAIAATAAERMKRMRAKKKAAKA